MIIKLIFRLQVPMGTRKKGKKKLPIKKDRLLNLS